jgi:hypothetical protein
MVWKVEGLSDAPHSVMQRICADSFCALARSQITDSETTQSSNGKEEIRELPSRIGHFVCSMLISDLKRYWMFQMRKLLFR